MSAGATTPGRGRVYMDLQPGERLAFGDSGIQVEVVAKSGRASRLCITLPREVRIVRDAADESRTKHGTVNATERG